MNRRSSSVRLAASAVAAPARSTGRIKRGSCQAAAVSGGQGGGGGGAVKLAAAATMTAVRLGAVGGCVELGRQSVNRMGVHE